MLNTTWISLQTSGWASVLADWMSRSGNEKFFFGVVWRGWQRNGVETLSMVIGWPGVVESIRKGCANAVNPWGRSRGVWGSAELVMEIFGGGYDARMTLLKRRFPQLDCRKIGSIRVWPGMAIPLRGWRLATVSTSFHEIWLLGLPAYWGFICVNPFSVVPHSSVLMHSRCTEVEGSE